MSPFPRGWLLLLGIVAYFGIALAVEAWFGSSALLAIGMFLCMAVLMTFCFFWQILAVIHFGRDLSGSHRYFQLLVVIALPLLFLAATGFLYGAFMGIGILLQHGDLDDLAAFRNTQDAVFAIIIGLLALGVGLTSLWRVSTWRLHHIRQLGILPRSRLRSAAVGLVELEGVARGLDGEAFIPFHADAGTSFYLEDTTGRILVDGTGAVVHSEFWWVFFSQRFPELVLHGRDPRRPGVRGLHAGDPVYVLGCADIQPRATGGGLVIRKRPVTRRGTGRNAMPGYRDHDIFFVTDRPEAGARRVLWRGLLANVTVAAVWTACSGVCLASGLLSM